MRFSGGWLLLFALLLAGCSGFFLASNGRLLLVVTVNPSFADPINFPGSQVQFTAIGNFNAAPVRENPMTNVVWTVDRSAFSNSPDPGHAIIDQNGVAQCAQGFIGTVKVIATAPADPNHPFSQSNQVFGTAQMRCP